MQAGKTSSRAWSWSCLVVMALLQLLPHLAVTAAVLSSPGAFAATVRPTSTISVYGLASAAVRFDPVSNCLA